MLGCTVFKYVTYQIDSKLTFLSSFEETTESGKELQQNPFHIWKSYISELFFVQLKAEPSQSPALPLAL